MLKLLVINYSLHQANKTTKEITETINLEWWWWTILQRNLVEVKSSSIMIENDEMFGEIKIKENQQ